MNAPLALTTLQAGPDDKAAAIDIYTQTTANPVIEGIQNLNTEMMDSVNALFGKAPSLGDALDTMGVKKLESKDILSGLISTDTQLQSAFSSLDSSLQSFITNVKGNVDVRLTADGLKTAYKLSSKVNVAGVTAMVNVLGGKKGLVDIVDISAQTNLLTNVLKVSAKMNIPNAFTTVIGAVTNRNVAMRVTKNILGTVVSSSNVNMLMNIADAHAKGTIRVNAGSFVNKFAANFKIPLGTRPGDYLQIGADISSSFGKLNPKWNLSITTGGRSLINGSIMLSSSGQFKAVMKSSANRNRITLGFNSSTSPRTSVPPRPAIRGLTQTTSKTPSGQNKTTRRYPDGKVQSFTEVAENDVLEEILAPVQFGVGTVGALSSCALGDPLTMGHVLNSFASQAGKFGTQDAKDSLLKSFPYSPLTGLGSQDSYIERS